MKSIKSTFFILLIGCFIYLGFADKSKKNAVTFDLKVKFPTNIIHKYRFDDDTKVTRIYEDGSKYSFTRYVTYFIKSWAIDEPENGFQNLFVTVDSIQYKFKDDENEVFFVNSQDEVPPAHIPDFMKAFLPSSKEFNLIFDSYGEADSVWGDQLQKELDYLTDSEYGIKNDDYRLKSFLDAYSLSTFKHLADPAKGVLAPYPVPRDSTWLVDFDFNINYETFRGYIKPKIEVIANNDFIIRAPIDSLVLVEPEYDLYNQKILANVDSSRADGKLEMKISSNGHVRYFQTQTESWVEGKAKNVRFREEITSIQKWDLLGMFHL